VEGGSFSHFSFKPEFSLVIFFDYAFAGKQAQSVAILLGG
jgi:hypothetical protein